MQATETGMARRRIGQEDRIARPEARAAAPLAHVVAPPGAPESTAT
ncbi:hypothetical protein [Roseicella aerolata]|uniref:Uncharacterized protein n=1 Tax=Roseicella aerolata TaxID=2883479 RepID=A0A9X1I8Y9_9PROT|nr:hypothetical protein [Roseicella aerolata]MCB4820384.1 hypothetical protein [Roseicella aerolata]